MLAGRYALLAEIGRDGAGARWLARDVVLERDVEVRILRPPFAEDQDLARRLAEALARAASLGSAAPPRVLDGGLDRGVRYVVREHIPADTLRERLAREGPLAPEAVARIGADLLAVLALLHREGLPHLALAPERVLLGSDGRVHLSDLGLGAAVRAASRPDAGELLAPSAVPPQPGEGAAFDERADVAAAGAVLFEALIGRPPGSERSPHALRPDIPPELDRAIVRALSPDPEERPSAASLARTLSELAPVAPGTPIEPSRGLLGWVLVPALVLLAAALAIGFGVWIGRFELGGPVGVRPAREGSAPAAPRSRPLRVVAARAFDPYGDGAENDGAATLAVDGDPVTAWRSENYFDGVLHKPGVGLLLDLGAERTVTGFRLAAPHPGYRFAVCVGDDPDALASAAGPSFEAGSETAGRLTPARGRYVLVWIVSVVDAGDGDRAEVAEVTVLGHG